MEEGIETIFSSFKGKKEELIPILQHVQEKDGYLSHESMLEIARFIKIPKSHIYSIATFYAQFRFTPVGKNHVLVCRGTACHVRGGPRILTELEKQLNISEGETTPDMKFTLETVACIGACGLAPNIVINKKTYGHLTVKKINDIISDIQSNKKRKKE